MLIKKFLKKINVWIVGNHLHLKGKKDDIVYVATEEQANEEYEKRVKK